MPSRALTAALGLLLPLVWAGAQAQSSLATVQRIELEPSLQTELAEPPIAAVQKHRLHGLKLGLVTSQGHYIEPGYMQTQGPRAGLLAGYTWPAVARWQPSLQGQLQSSAMQYSSPSSGELNNVPDHELDLRLTALHPLGSTFASPLGNLQAGAYTGLGYRWHFSDLRGTTTAGSIGYRRINQRLYAPLGIQIAGSAPRSLTLNLEYTLGLQGTHTTRMTDIGATQDATVSQKSQGWAVRVGWQFRPGWTLAAYHLHWSTQATQAWSSTRFGVTQRYFEPASRWRESGLQIAYHF